MIPLIAIIIGALLLAAILFIGLGKSKVSKNSDQCSSDTDCKPNERCNQNKCIPLYQKECGVFPFTKLEKCKLNTNDCKKCINTPSFSCQKISWGKPKITQAGKNYKIGISEASTGEGVLYQKLKVSITKIGASGEVQELSIIEPNVALKSGTILTVKPSKDQANQVNNQEEICTIQLTDDITFYKFNAGPKVVVNVPESEDGFGWCLPNFSEQDSQVCNTATSDYALFENIDGSYYWGCVCKYPEWMTHRGNSRNDTCTRNLGCKNLYVPPPDAKRCRKSDECDTGKCCTLSSRDGTCLAPGETANDKVHYCMTEWTLDSQNDPILGACVCDTGFLPAYLNSSVISKTCIQDSCNQGGGKYNPNTETCDCPSGSVSCDVVGSKATIQDNDCTINALPNASNHGICIPDPCGPGGISITLDDGTHTCSCKTPCVDEDCSSCKPPCVPTTPDGTGKSNGCVCTGNMDYYKSVNDNRVYGGIACQKVCEPNFCGNRGTCQFETVKKTETCVNCNCPYCNPRDANCDVDKDAQKLCMGIRTDKGPNGSTCIGNSDCCSNSCFLFGVPNGECV